MIDRPTIERIKETADIVDVVSEFVSLKKVGANYRGLCPFHNDHSPSFYVSPARRTCHCFVCGEGGDSVGFIMKHEQLTYPEALKWLANRYHITIQEKQLTDRERQEQSEREGLYIVNDWAAKYFHDILLNDIDGRAIGMQYFRQRGIRDDIIEKFQLGFCLADRQAMSKEALRKGYKDEFLVQTGLCYRRDNGELLDRFAGRVMFPWIGVSGKVVAFGGRVLDSRTKGVNQKYVNSPDSPIYHKDHELYGIYQAKKAIGKENAVYMVEGYTDVISMHQCGIENVVANSGTALSKHQIHILHRFTTNIVLLYDGDAAGIKAATRGTDMLLEEGMNVKVLLLPDGDDPDSFSKKHTADEFRKYIDDHKTDFIAFKTKVMLDGVTDPQKRAEAVSSIVKSISVIGDPIVRAAYIQDCASRLGFSEQVLIAKMNEEIRNYRDAKRKEEEQQRRRDQQQYQDYRHTGQIPGQAAGQAPYISGTLESQVAPGSLVAPDSQVIPENPVVPENPAVSGNPVASTNPVTPSAQRDPYYDDYPPEAFLPPEAFSAPPSGTAYQTQGGAGYQSQGASPSPTATPGATYQPRPQVVKKQETSADLIIKYVIRHGGQRIYENVETEDGQTIDLTLAQFVEYDLSNDNLAFTNPAYNQILAEAAKQSGEGEFDSVKYFTMHPDYEVSQLAISLTEDDVLLSKSMQINYTDDLVREHITHLLLDFRKEYIDEKFSSLKTDIKNEPDAERRKELMRELMQVTAIRSAISKKVGGSIVPKR